jgi:D-serine deaminase-like pyridoxal phosphate-dependent protein
MLLPRCDMHPAWFHIDNEADIPSPALLFYRSRIEHNLRLMIQIAGDAKRLRPHVKTHKCAEIIAMQIEMGITRFKASTIAEAEMCAAVGATDVLLAMPCVGINAHRLAELAQKFPETQFSSIADAEETIRFLASAAQQHQVTLGVFLELDCGMSRTGIVPGDEAAVLAHVMKDTPMLQFRGLHAYDGHIHDESLDVRRERCDAAFEAVVQFRCRLQGEGIVVKELVAGGSPTFGIHAGYADRTLSPGTTVLWDFGYGDKYPGDLPFQPAAVLLARVISKPGKNRITLDLGHKSVAPENPHPRVRFIELPDATAVMQSEEHLVLETERAHEFVIGQALHGIPRHVCPTVSMHGEAYVISGGKTTERWPITARNRLITV